MKLPDIMTRINRFFGYEAVTQVQCAQGPMPKRARKQAPLPPLPAGGPYQMLVATPSGQVIVDDVMIGDVFLCSGQSNMELATAQAQNSFQIAGAADEGLRLLTVAKRVATAPQSHASDHRTSGQRVDLSAAGLFFTRCGSR